MCNHIKALSKAQMVRELDTVGNASPLVAKLSASVRAITPSDPITGYRLEYSYGDLIINNGIFAAPGAAGQPTPCADCQSFQEKSKYNKENPVPLLLNVTKDLEIFRIVRDVHAGKPKTEDGEGVRSRRSSGGRHRLGRQSAVRPDSKPAGKPEPPTWLLPRTVPVVYREPGELIGLFEALRSLRHQPPWYGPFYVSAGSRNVHLLLPLTHSTIVDRLEGYGVNIRDKYARLDLDQYGKSWPTDYGRPPGIAADWRILRKIIDDAKKPWKASLLLLPAIVFGAEVTDESVTNEQRELRRELLGAAFDQLQDSLLALTSSAEGSLHGSLCFKNVDPNCLSAVLAHLRACIRGEAMLHCAASERNCMRGPWADALEWIRQLKDYEVASKNYRAVILEPGRLMTARTGGCMSLTHPLISEGLRFRERDHPKMQKFDERVFARHLADVADYVVYEQNKLELAAEWAAKHATDWPMGTCLQDFMILRYSRG